MHVELKCAETWEIVVLDSWLVLADETNTGRRFGKAGGFYCDIENERLRNYPPVW